MKVATEIQRPIDRQDELKATPKRIRFLDVPAHRFVMIDGSGPPAPEAFEARMPGLYGLAYGLRFALKARGVEGRVGPLEGRWWTTDGVTDLGAIFGGGGERATWRWTLMIVLPPDATEEELEMQLATARGRLDPALASGLRVEEFEEGLCAQLMHVGPYAEERATIERLHAGIESAGLAPIGRHHELYLGDPRRSAPERLRTILRQPVG
jgi:hypothetical protein